MPLVAVARRIGLDIMRTVMDGQVQRHGAVATRCVGQRLSINTRFSVGYTFPFILFTGYLRSYCIICGRNGQVQRIGALATGSVSV